jgi:hypothetical protein
MAKYMMIIPYLLNILILLPVCIRLMKLPLSADPAGNLSGYSSAAFRVLVVSLWCSILIGSLIGVFYPRPMVVILGLQVIYKTIFLLRFWLPRILNKSDVAVPGPLIAVFLIVVALYPFFIYGILFLKP